MTTPTGHSTPATATAAAAPRTEPRRPIVWQAFHVEGGRCPRAEISHDCPRSHDYRRGDIA